MGPLWPSSEGTGKMKSTLSHKQSGILPLVSGGRGVMKTIQYASDLHLEFPENKNHLMKNPIVPEGDILLLAGDIVPLTIIDEHKDFFNYISDQFQETYWIPGNHEFYHSDLNLGLNTVNMNIRGNIHLVNNEVISFGGFDLILSTLWSKISPNNRGQIERSLNDFRLIKKNGFPLNSENYNDLHKRDLEFIKQALGNSTTNSIIVTHHVPTFSNYPDKYKGDSLNEAFAVELYSLITKSGPNYWIYGHSHFNTEDFTIGNTHLITNQMGYVMYGEHKSFNLKKTFSI